MWASENERIGFQKCTPIGYFAGATAEMVLLCAAIMLIAAPLILAQEAIRGTFQTAHLWLLAAPCALGSAGVTLHCFSSKLAGRKRFHYDHELTRASWIEAGERRTYEGPV